MSKIISSSTKGKETFFAVMGDFSRHAAGGRQTTQSHTVIRLCVPHYRYLNYLRRSQEHEKNQEPNVVQKLSLLVLCVSKATTLTSLTDSAASQYTSGSAL